MSKFIINGGKKLNGAWRVQGMKNAATPILAATLLTRAECVIHNIPRISDFDHMLALAQSLGAACSWDDEHTLRICTLAVKTSDMDYLLTKRMRSSVLFLGPLLALAGRVKMPEPGGCNLGNRPLDSHFAAFRSLGATIEFTDKYYTIAGDKLQGAKVKLKEKSVTATENVLMAAVIIPGRTVIRNAAQEPHVTSLGKMLAAMGANIKGIGTDTLEIHGVAKLSGVEWTVIPDQLEVGTMAVLAALTGSEVRIGPVVSADMAIVKDKLKEAGVAISEDGDAWRLSGANQLRAFRLDTAPYPGFPTDLQAPFAVLATQAKGESIIHDPLYENRLGYIKELTKMGAAGEILDAHTARIDGPTPLHGEVIRSLDIRAGATLLIAGLLAAGETVINEAEIIDRGYEKIDERLRALGADIQRVE